MLTVGDRWHSLGAVPFGSAYNAKLRAVTYEFTKRNAAPARVNGSALLQVRTNEVPLSPVHAAALGAARVRPQLPGPAPARHGEAGGGRHAQRLGRLGGWAVENAQAILAGQHEVPSSWKGKPFLAAAAPVPSNLAWVVPGVDENVRHAFALATCSGCHKSETGTNFLHVRMREAGARAAISAFLAEQLSPTGPRVADFVGLLNTTNASKVKNGSGRDHLEHPSNQD